MADDQFGVRQIYPTKAGGESWAIDTDPDGDGRIRLAGNGGEINYNEVNNYYTISQNDNVRIGIETSDGYKQSQVSQDHNTINSRGYMQTPKDWKNIEMTAYFKYSGSTDTVIAFYTRTGVHSSSRSCEGFSYKGTFNLKFGLTRFVKEQWHVNQLSTEEKDALAIGSPKNKWIGMKFIIYNFNNNKNVKGEMYLDKDETNTWVLADTFVDTGGWGENGVKCQKKGGDDPIADTPDMIGTHGGPLVHYKWEGGNGNVQFNKLSVREIIPPTLNEPDPDPDPGGGGGGTDPGGGGGTDPPPPSENPPTTGDVSATLIGVYNINFDESDGCSGLIVDVPPLLELVTVPKTHEITIDHNRDAVGLITHDESLTAGGNVNDKSVLIGKKIRRVTLIMKKWNGATGTATLNIRRGNDNTIITQMGSIDVSTLTTNDRLVNFENLNNTHRMAKNDRLVLNYSEGSAATYIILAINQSDFWDGRRTCLVRREPNPSSHYVEDLTYDLAGTIYI